MSRREVAGAIAVPEPVLGIVRTLEEAGHEAWCVGGALRDALLGLPHADFDVATAARPEQVRALFRRTVPVGERFGTIGVLDRAGVLHEVTTFRHDVSTDGRHAVVAFGASLEEDLARRDFTINALAYHPLRGEWRDPFGGADDLRGGVVRAVGTAEERFREDFLRILRGLRFAARFGFTIEPATWDAMRAEAHGLATLSAERVREEWFKGLRTAATVGALSRLWIDAGAAAVWLPELRQVDPVLDELLSAEPRDPVLLTVVLCARPGEVLRRLKASNAEIARSEETAAAPLAPAAGDEASVRRWLARTGERTADVLRMHELIHGRPAPWLDVVWRVRSRGDAWSRRQLAIDGNQLVALGLSGPAVGRVLDALLERVIDDPSLNTRERLLALARELA
jgi:tRNA nucleotidyltransferase (CCA-adding enzyme)